jgi:hypothetical protein
MRAIDRRLLTATSGPATSSDFTSAREIFTPPPATSIAVDRVRSRSVA